MKHQLRTAGLAGALILVHACASNQAAPEHPESTLPSHVDVTFTGATIGPSKADGKPWDGVTPVPPKVAESIGVALMGVEPHAAAVSALGAAVVQGIVPPEPFGTATLLADGERGEERRELDGGGNTCTPTWADAPTWTRVRLSPSTRIRIELIDKDLAYDDSIGTFEINAQDLENAWRSDHIFQVRVAEQTNNQVLFAGFSVRESADE